MNKSKAHVNDWFQPILLFALLVGMIIFLNFYSDAFMTKENWLNILDNHMAHQLILGIGMTFVIATAGIDLSVGAILALSGIVLALALNNGYSISVSVVFALLAATGMGTINGLLVANFSINPLIITLGTSSVFRGLSIIVTGGTPIYGMPKEFLQFAKGEYAIPLPVVLAIGVLICSVILLRYTKWGQYTLSLGNSSEALKRLGVELSRKV